MASLITEMDQVHKYAKYAGWMVKNDINGFEDFDDMIKNLEAKYEKGIHT